MSYALYLTYIKPLIPHYRPDTIALWSFVFGALVVIPVGLPEVPLIPWDQLLPAQWLGLAFVVLFTTFLAYGLNMFALVTLSPATVGAYIYLQPVLATAIALWAGQDMLNAEKVSAAVMIFLGVWMSGRRFPLVKP
jgi:drug/metabolite transporter (DMT)-like permease